jgi:hypothetical protein
VPVPVVARGPGVIRAAAHHGLIIATLIRRNVASSFRA